MRFFARRSLLGLADLTVTSPVFRWTWTGPANEDLIAALGEFRPIDRESVLEMMAGRYLLASKLIDTHGSSPFAQRDAHPDWVDELHSFAWLRHFREARGEEERRYARTLALEWIEHAGRFNRRLWAPALTARRVLNWLRHYNLLASGANAEDSTAIARSLGTQIQSLRLRGAVANEPLDALLVAIALCAAALADERHAREVAPRVRGLHKLLRRQLDADGLHRTRSAKVQLQILVELSTLNQALGRFSDLYANEFGEVLELMHRALDAISLGTGEPAYFNGTGQMPHDLVVAVQAQSPTRMRRTGSAGGYGKLVLGAGIVVADSGLVPPPKYSGAAHAGALSFEFSYGRELVVGNCGPPPVGLEETASLFRTGIAHSCPTINAVSAAAIPNAGPMAGRLVPVGAPPELSTEPEDATLTMTCFGYRDRFGLVLERRLTLLAEGKSLVGQDRLVGTGRVSGACAIRFHLAPGTIVESAEDIVRLRLPSGAQWTFLWEGAQLRIEDSVRQSAHFGYHRTRQIVLDTPVAEAGEVAWIFTLEEAPGGSH